MQAKLRVRISLRQKRKEYIDFVTKNDVLHTINRINSYLKLDIHPNEISNEFDNFKASISFIKPANLIELGFSRGLNYYSPEFEDIAIATIELGTHLAINEVADYPVALNYVTEAVIDKFKELNSESMLFIFIENNYMKTSSFILNYNFFKKFLSKSNKKHILLEEQNKYRFFLDDIMLIERIYPKELSINEQLEEVLYVELSPGKHKLHVEMLTDYYNDSEIIITDVAIEDQIFRNINDTSCSLEVH
jgi:hypothetical protein